MTEQHVQVFCYLPALDAFVVTDEYLRLAEALGLVEWNPVVWIGRLFLRDNDFGEHWFDNWDAREAIAKRAKKLGYESEDLLIIDPEFMADGADGPCHDAAQRKRFWTDVLRSLTLSYETLFEEARANKRFIKANGVPSDTEIAEAIGYVADLEERICRIRKEAT